MASSGFQSIKKQYDDVFGEFRCFFRATDKGVTVISLDEDCPSFIGIRRSRNDKSCYLRPGEHLGDKSYYQDLRRDFERFKASIRRSSAEEQLVIILLRQTLENGLIVQQISPDHCLLNHEWRFVGGTKSPRSDVLAVNLRTRDLCIIEFKSSCQKVEEAATASRQHAEAFLRYADEYSEFFTKQLNVMGQLYRNERAACGEVSTREPELYFGYPTSREIIISRITQ